MPARASAGSTSAAVPASWRSWRQRQAHERGRDVTFEVADVEALPYDDSEFDIVTSSVGAIFAPDHARVASELARVCRPGGRLACRHVVPVG